MLDITVIENGYTLKMFADESNKRHDNVKRDFNKMIDSLSEAEQHLLKFEEVVYESKGGDGAIRKYETYSMDKRTALLFASKFNDSLRLKLILKIEEQQELIDAKKDALIAEQQKHRLVTYADNTKSLRKIIRMYYADVLGEREAWRYLVKKSIVKYVPKETYVKELINCDYGRQSQDSIVWDEDAICGVLDVLADSKDSKE